MIDSSWYKSSWFYKTFLSNRDKHSNSLKQAKELTQITNQQWLSTDTDMDTQPTASTAAMAHTDGSRLDMNSFCYKYFIKRGSLDSFTFK